MSDDDESFAIRLVDESGDPVSDREITVFYGGMLSGCEHRYTDDDGWAEFPMVGHTSIGKVYSYELNDDILVSKREVLLTDGEEIHDGATFSFTIQDG